MAGLLFFASTLKAQSINDNAIMSDNFPKMLSEYNFFNDPIAQIPANKVIPYQLMTELFSDYTKKVTMQNLFHDGGFSFTGMSETAMDSYLKIMEDERKDKK